MAGHCQVFVAVNKIFIYGGITAINKSLHYEYSNEAYLWLNESWLSIPKENPCPIVGQNLAFQQPCAVTVQSNCTKIIVVTFSDGISCTSILNLSTFEWAILNGKEGDTSIPIGGHLAASLDKSRMFYLGGIYYKPQETQSLDVYELSEFGWHITDVKSPFGTASNKTKSYPSMHNVSFH